MSKQSIFPITYNEKYNPVDFICSSSNSAAYNLIMYWPQDGWGNKPYENSLLLIGPKSSGKTFLTHLWRQRGVELSLSAKQVVLENIDSPNILQEEILHSFNSANEEGKYLLLTASKMPQFTLSDLSSRINSLARSDIAFPDDELVKILIFKLFSDNSIKVGGEVINYLTKILSRDFASIHDAIERINRRALEAGRKVTIPLIKECL